MREPRPRQRFPENGLAIYELLKDGKWTTAKLLFAQPVGYQHPRWPKPYIGEHTLVYQPHFDPMLYFWPVEGFHLIVRTDNLDSDITMRIVRAALRDGAELVVTNVATMLTSDSNFYDQESGWKKTSQETRYEVPPPSKKSRYEMTLALIKQADREAGR